MCNHKNMDHTITFDEVTGFLKNPPTLSPRPDLVKIRALRKHTVPALKQLTCPQSVIYGWWGLILAPMVYALLEPNPFQSPIDPGAVAVYTQFVTASMMKTADAIFTRAQNKWNLFRIIQRACFCMLDELVSDQFKVLNIPTLKGLNASMSIIRSIQDYVWQAQRYDTVC